MIPMLPIPSWKIKVNSYSNLGDSIRLLTLYADIFSPGLEVLAKFALFKIYEAENGLLKNI